MMKNNKTKYDNHRASLRMPRSIPAAARRGECGTAAILL
jgi:hypothetical protein